MVYYKGFVRFFFNFVLGMLEIDSKTSGFTGVLKNEFILGFRGLGGGVKRPFFEIIKFWR